AKVQVRLERTRISRRHHAWSHSPLSDLVWAAEESGHAEKCGQASRWRLARARSSLEPEVSAHLQGALGGCGAGDHREVVVAGNGASGRIGHPAASGLGIAEGGCVGKVERFT